MTGCALILAACRRADTTCHECGTVRIAAVREPASILPPLVFESVGRDISDRVYERLATFKSGGATIDPTAFRPALADSWERVDSLTWRFHLRPGALWHDSVSVTASDVVFSFAAYTDSTLETAAASALTGVTAEATDSATVLIHFPRYSPEQLYDATWHVRILPMHIWSAMPPASWPSDTSLAHLVGSGPYRVAAGSAAPPSRSMPTPPGSRRRPFAASSGASPPIPTPRSTSCSLGKRSCSSTPARRHNPIALPPTRCCVSCPIRPPSTGSLPSSSLVAKGKPDPRFSDRAVRQALTLSVDRATIARAVFGPNAAVPEGPVSRLQWIAGDGVVTLPFDTAAAAGLLDAAGWKRDASGHAGSTAPLGSPSACSCPPPARAGSCSPRHCRNPGAGSVLTCPSTPSIFPSSSSDSPRESSMSTSAPISMSRVRGGSSISGRRAGWGALNYGRYANPVVDSLIGEALSASALPAARPRWHEVLDSMNVDVPAVFLYTPEQSAVVSRRITGVAIDPWSWLEGVERWGLEPAPSTK